MPGVADTLLLSVKTCDEDIRKDMLENVILCGGNTLFPGKIENAT